MQFASKTREQAGFTPQPYRFYFSGKSMPASAIEGWDNSHAHVYHDPSNQWHGVGTNPVNLVLAEYRNVDEEECREYALDVAHLFWDIDHDLVGDDVTLLVDVAMVEHAHRILSRLHGI